ncbi:MAG TPA: hypothetical protein DDZ84_07660 [Firmicutes bacterium]|jgi:LysM repeat protein|nr:hypothetical protein [Bacillota bacterium]
MKRAAWIVLLAAALFVLVGWSPQRTAAKVGLGHIISIAKSKDLSVDKNGKVTTPVAQVDTTIAAVAFDREGRVVAVAIDTAQTKVNFAQDLKVASDLAAENKTKVELGDGYGMRKASSIKKEWHEQIAELERWMVGKTVAEIKSLKVKQRDASHPAVPDAPELTSTVTVTVGDYIAAVEEAYKNAVEVPAGAVKLGLGHEISTAKSKTATAQVDLTVAATLFDKDGKVVRTVIDTAQTKVPFGKDGKVAVDRNGEFKSKVELGDGYGMRKASSIKKEWHEQIAEFEKWMAGKTVAEIKSLKVRQRDASHPAVPDAPELTSTVTVTVGDYIAVVAESFANAK